MFRVGTSAKSHPDRHTYWIVESNSVVPHFAETMTEELCAYCLRAATTRDHVPPKRLFTPPLLDNLITVPACGDCNHGASDDDEAFRNELSIMAGSFRESANAAERLQPTLRAILRKRATREKMVHAAKPVERYSIGGIYLGRGYAVPPNSEAHKRVLTRIVRGLYWHQTGNSLGNDVHVDLMSIDKTTPNWHEIFDIPRRLRLQNVLVGDGDTFQYFWGLCVPHGVPIRVPPAQAIAIARRSPI